MPKYKNWIVMVSQKSIMIDRDGEKVVSNNETGLVIVDSEKQDVRLALNTKGYRTKRKL